MRGARPGADRRVPRKGATTAGESMTGDRSRSLQDVFLNHVRKEKMPVTIFLVNGVKLQGVITWFDNFCVLLRRDEHAQLVYKHAVSTVMPARPVQLFDPDAAQVAPDAVQAEEEGT